MHQETIQMPEKGTYKWNLFSYWSDDFRQNQTDHSAYIALNFAGALDACRAKLQALVQRHTRLSQLSGATAVGRRHAQAIERLQHTMTGAAMSFERGFRLR